MPPRRFDHGDVSSPLFRMLCMKAVGRCLGVLCKNACWVGGQGEARIWSCDPEVTSNLGGDDKATWKDLAKVRHVLAPPNLRKALVKSMHVEVETRPRAAPLPPCTTSTLSFLISRTVQYSAVS